MREALRLYIYYIVFSLRGSLLRECIIFDMCPSLRQPVYVNRLFSVMKPLSWLWPGSRGPGCNKAITVEDPDARDYSIICYLSRSYIHAMQRLGFQGWSHGPGPFLLSMVIPLCTLYTCSFVQMDSILYRYTVVQSRIGGGPETSVWGDAPQ